MSDFVHLHNHSEFSLLDGLSKIKPMVERAKQLGMKALALTDHGNLYGALKFYLECRNQGIKPIIGAEMYVAKRSRFDKDVEHDSEYNHLILLAKNNTGYKNLIKLVSLSHLEGYYYKPRIDLELLKEYKEELICLSGCLNGYLSKELVQGEIESAEKKAIQLWEIFGENNFYLELQKHPKISEQDKLNEGLVLLSKKMGIPVIATNDNHYISPGDAEAQDVLLAIQTQSTILDKDRSLSMIDSPDFYVRDQDEMKGLFIQWPTAIENTVKVEEMVDLNIETGHWILPHFPIPKSRSYEEYLKQMVKKNLRMRYKEVTPELDKRVKYELSVITGKGYTPYFLIVQDFVNWAKDKGIAVGPGRGSVAGSVVAYILRITELDPLEYNLPFERFLNPDRPTPPDIDLDFADDRRDEVIKYVTNKFGHEKVAQIITFGTMEARQSVRDVGRALGMPYVAPDRIAKMIPPGVQGFPMTIEKALEINPELFRAYTNEPETKKLIDLARKLEGVARHSSTHAAGLVIADKDLMNYTPIQKEVNGDRIITQYDMYDLDLNINDSALGLLKIDLLGLRNLTIIQNALRFIKQDQRKTINISNIPLDDKRVFDLISSGETTGIFQLESQGMRRLARDLKPSKISDLSAMIALYRPGPMAWIKDFIEAKRDPKRIHYPHPDLRPILEETYGIAVYQEQCMLIANKMADYSMAEADNLRKAIGKKKPELMRKEREKFTSGCLKHRYTWETADAIFSLIEKFVGYGFNKAHSASYAIIAYQTAFLKTHFPVEFMTAVLTAESKGATGPAKNEKISQAVAECRRINMTLLPPSVNNSSSEFTIENKNQIRFGLSAIKNVGTAAISSILSARVDGKFLNLYDFSKRVDLQKVNKKTIDSLIKAGAMDEFGKRSPLLLSMEGVLGKIGRLERNRIKNQVLLFDDPPDDKDFFPNDSIEEFTTSEKLALEKELLGFFLTGHPLSQITLELEKKVSHNFHELEEEKEGSKIRVGGLVSNIKRIITKRGNSEMAFVTLEDQMGYIVECVFFPKVFENLKGIVLKDSIVIIEGRLQFKEERPVIIADIAQKLLS